MSTIYIKYGHQGRSLVKELLEAAGLSSSLDAAAQYALKPNLVLAKPSASGATTDPEVVAGVIEYLQDHGCRRITVMESSWIGAGATSRAYQVCGYTEMAQKYGIELLDLKTDRSEKVKTATGDELEVFAQPRQADFLINIPVLKAHCQTKLTCALKNLKGCIPDREKRRFHTQGLHRPIAALNTVLKQDLVVVDGLIGDLTFEEGGTPVEMDRILVSRDPVAVDAYAASLLGYHPADIAYIPLAEELGVGSIQAEVVELNQGRDSALSPDRLVTQLRQGIHEDQACSACLGSLLHALRRLQDQGLSVPASLYIGQGWQDQKLNGLGIGSCTRSFARHVPGCPPSAQKIMAALCDL